MNRNRQLLYPTLEEALDQTGRVRQRGRRIVLARNGTMPSPLGRQNASAIAECRGHTKVIVI